MIPDSAAIRAASRGSTTPALLSPSVSRISTLLLAFAPRRRSTPTATPSPIAVASSSLQRLGIDHPPLAVADRPGNLEPLDDIDQGAMVEGQRTLAVGEPAEGDEPDEIVGAARQSAGAASRARIPGSRA